MKANVYLMFVDIKDGVQSNKFYNMTDNGNDTFTVEYGRVGSSSAKKNYPISKWNSTYNSKVRKGYKDISDLKTTTKVIANDSGNKDFDNFYNIFSKYTGDSVKRTYLVEGCSQGQIDEAQFLIDKITKSRKIDDMNKHLFDLYKVIPRRMNDVRNHMITSLKDKSKIISIEQDALDSMDSANIMNVSNPFKELNLGCFEEIQLDKNLKKLLESNQTRYKVSKVYKVYNSKAHKDYNDWMKSQNNKFEKLLIHGTRCPNTFSILKTDLLIRPSNAVSFAGSVYGQGTYFSDSFVKSMNYTGNDPDKIFFISKVHMGNFYTYKGWYRDGKDISRSDMNYQYLKNKGYDSLYVNAGDGLLRDEYISYNNEQNFINYIILMK